MAKWARDRSAPLNWEQRSAKNSCWQEYCAQIPFKCNTTKKGLLLMAKGQKPSRDLYHLFWEQTLRRKYLEYFAIYVFPNLAQQKTRKTKKGARQPVQEIDLPL
jgi:hypothetical protein